MTDADAIATCALVVSIVSAVFSLIVAIASATFAFYSWRATKKANDINLHANQKTVHDAFFELKMHMQQSGEFAKLSEVSKFYYPARNAKFYFPKKLAEELEKYFDVCFSVADAARVERSQDSQEIFAQWMKQERSLSQSIEPQLVKKLTLS
ncbi:hypothetical protein [Janthinobacterium svalbardensis]|uniref:hypothetical protein n=1 Tax=Janthinobacterium svalbardensis TaxID=368607 RepID=UPI002FCD9FFC